MENNGKILIVDDNEDVLLSLNMLLQPHVEALRVLKGPERLLEFMDSFQPDVILLDMNFTRDAVSGEEGYEWLARVLQHDPLAVVLFITAFVDTEKAVRAIKAGAVDFIPKPWDKEKLLGIVESAVELRKSRVTPPLPSPQGQTRGGAVMLGNCPAMNDLRQQIEAVAMTDANVLVTGENGTGKDVVAHLVHELSARSRRPMVTIDLGSLSESLFESEIFGHEKGAFTDAHATKEGRVEQADGSTLFLDEIGNLSLAMQQKLLTLIEKRQFSRVGGTKVKHADVRLVCATNADLQQRVHNKSFRQDLFYRINTITLHLPPLRERGDDIFLLAEYFARQLAERYGKPMPELSEEVKQKLLSYSWPGNVRELQHVMERMVVLNEPPQFSATTAGSYAAAETLNLAELEHQAILRAIDLCNGNLTQAAELLGITRYALYRKIDRMER